MSAKEENEPLMTAAFYSAMRPVRTLVTFSLCVVNYMISYESAYSSFRAPDCLFTEENEPKPYKLISQCCVPSEAAVVY